MAGRLSRLGIHDFHHSVRELCHPHHLNPRPEGRRTTHCRSAVIDLNAPGIDPLIAIEAEALPVCPTPNIRIQRRLGSTIERTHRIFLESTKLNFCC